MELFYTLTVADDYSQKSQYDVLKRVNFAACKIILNFLNGRKKKGGHSHLWGTDQNWWLLQEIFPEYGQCP